MNFSRNKNFFEDEERSRVVTNSFQGTHPPTTQNDMKSGRSRDSKTAINGETSNGTPKSWRERQGSKKHVNSGAVEMSSRLQRGARQQQSEWTRERKHISSTQGHRENAELDSSKRTYQIRKQFPLNFPTVKKMMDDDMEPQHIVKRFTEEQYGLSHFLEQNQANWEIIELVIAVTGRFCEKGGVKLFHNAFIKIVQTLAEKKVFQNIEAVIFSIPKSRATNLGSVRERLKRLIENIGHLTTEMLSVMPALACNHLGEKFFEDISALKNVSSIRDNITPDVFDALQEGSVRLRNSWEQHSKKAENQDREGQRQRNREQRQELLSILKPPDDFRQLNVMPNWEDVCVESDPFLRPNIVNGSYQDVDTYLDVQFRLLREDFFSPLREGLLAYRTLLAKNQKRFRVDNIRLYFDVKVKDDDSQANVYVLEFSTQALGRINWEGSKRLLFGSLLLLSADGFNSFLLFTVVDRKPDQLLRGRVKVKLEGKSSLPSYAMTRNLVMVESSVFFEAYRSVLIALQRISPAHFPMEDYILCRNVLPAEPDYLKDVLDPVYDLTSVRQVFSNPATENLRENDEHDAHDEGEQIPLSVQRSLKHVSIFDEYKLPNAEVLGLDPSQTKALYSALTRKLVVIQGPPGTGKTYLGLKIVQALLKNEKYWVGVEKPNPTPILVICYTNHALDQFLEGIMKFTKNIVRIGGQSKCEALEPFSLREWKKQATVLRKRPAQYRSWLYEARNMLAETKSELDKRLGFQRAVTFSSVIHEDSLLTLGVLPQKVYQSFVAIRAKSSSSLLPSWLGLESIKTLKEVIGFFTVSKPSANAEAEITKENESREEEEWDKEDLEEIEGHRIMDDELDDETVGSTYADLAPRTKSKPEKLFPRDGYRFAFNSAMLDEKVHSMRQLLENLEGDDVRNTKALIKEILQQRELFEELLEILPVVDANEFNQLVAKDLLRMPYVERWKIYSYLRSEIIEKLIKEVNKMKDKFYQQSNEMKDVETIETAEIIREAHVVGITTTGAAKQRALIEHLKSKIVVVEEAAEVLEAHIVTSLSTSCQQLILIGDHQQLRPSTTVYKLAKDYHLDVSLFERLIKNGVKPCVLEVQHRMRPEVARLIVPAIYPYLKNHETVLRYSDVPGMTKNVFFLAHKELEKGDKSDQESRSHLNPFEADVALALARHLLLQGLDPVQITILTTYSGQLLHLRKLRRSHATLQGVRISVVDNFQGEENDVIILSLVRSNEEAKVGFLKTENRICVALSRAKKGFYLIGNMENLERGSKLWREISKTLVANREIGPYLELFCEVHRTVIKANQPVHFPPEGGCFLKCLTNMPCGHVCSKICHIEDREHERQKCHEACERKCLMGHPCPKKCFQDCHPCLTRMPKVILPCNHTQIMECYKNPEEEYCVTKVIKPLLTCQHHLELDCGMPVENIKCQKLCGMQLDCDHLCDRICHKRSSHSKLPCTQPCRRTTCVEKHPCPGKCFEKCGVCMVDVVKQLPCGHDGVIKCWSLPKDAYCKVKVQRILLNCQHIATFDCSQTSEGYRCTRKCEKIVCNDGHICRKYCWEPCGPCNTRVERKLPCGHTAQTTCSKDPLTIKCKFPKEVVLPSCRHKVQIACGDTLEQAVCPKPCDIRLDCGHQCTELCHAKDDPNHEKYLCKKACSRNKVNCKNNHRCGKKCHEDCDLCMIKIERTLPCGHNRFAECHLNDADILCNITVTKTITECGHTTRLTCSTPPSRDVCKENCTKQLSCGHNCKKKCKETCSVIDCLEPVKTITMSYCGHAVTKPCNEYRRSPAVTLEEKTNFLQVCSQSCRATLSCEHSCQGSCSECFNGRVHKACEQECGRTLVCSHNCGVKCASSCPPCKKKCEYRCQHSRCGKNCSDPCVDCVEPCGWRCEHYSCQRKCHEPCNRPPCNEPCRKLLPCNHPCIGLCGEVCPPLCRICNKEELTEFILYGTEGDDDSRFIYLEDCKHVIEVEGMDHWMEMKEGEVKEIQMKCCPRCKTIIRLCYRYGNQIKKNFDDIVEVKRKILRSRVTSKEFSERLQKKIEESKVLINQLTNAGMRHSVTIIISFGLKGIQDFVSPKNVGKKLQFPSIDDDTRYLLEVQVDSIERVLGLMTNAFKGTSSTNIPGRKTVMSPLLLKDVLDRTLRLVNSLLHRDRFSIQETECFVAETERLNLIQAFYSLKSAPGHNGNSLIVQETKQVEEILMKNVQQLRKSEIANLKETLRKMSQKLNTGLGISDIERTQILKAMGLTQGHWFKCPNGHIYAIGECGGAMQEAKCNECGAKIGGGSHQLRTDNRFAGEMDGAQFPAWSEHANNMGNYFF